MVNYNFVPSLILSRYCWMAYSIDMLSAMELEMLRGYKSLKNGLDAGAVKEGRKA